MAETDHKWRRQRSDVRLSRQIAAEERAPQVLGSSTASHRKENEQPRGARPALPHALSVMAEGLKEGQGQGPAAALWPPHPMCPSRPSPRWPGCDSQGAATSLGVRQAAHWGRVMASRGSTSESVFELKCKSDLIKKNLIITRILVSNPTTPLPKPGPNKPVLYKII